MLRKALAAFILVIFVCGMCYAEQGSQRAGTVPVKINNTICPVTGEEVDIKNPVTAEYKGKVYNFCCPMCVQEFEKDPEKYIAKIK